MAKVDPVVECIGRALYGDEWWEQFGPPHKPEEAGVRNARRIKRALKKSCYLKDTTDGR